MLSHHHDPLLIVAAGLICAISALGASFVLRNVATADESQRKWWLYCATLVIGFGAWTTHFVAMLGFEAHSAISFLLLPTVLSLLAGLGAALLSLQVLAREIKPHRAALAGVGVSLGTAALHYVGMSAVLLPHAIEWNMLLVACSIIAGMAFSAPAFVLMLRGERGWAHSACGATMLALSVLALHFIGMEAMIVTNEMAAPHTGLAVSSVMLTAILSLIAAVIVGWTGTLLLLERTKQRQERSRLREYHLLMNGVRDAAIYMLDPGGKVVTWNKGAERLKQYTADEIVGHSFARFFPKEEQASGKPARALALARENGLHRDAGLRVRKDGSVFFASTTIEPIFGEDGELHGYAKITRDLSEVKRVEDQLDTALDNMQHGLLLLDSHKRLVLHNRRVHELYKLAENNLQSGMTVDQIIQETIARGVGEQTQKRAIASARAIYDDLLSTSGGKTIVAESDDGMVHSLCSRSMDEGGWVVTIEDITERHKSSKRLEYMATHDSLTGLPNRERFAELMGEALLQAANRNGHIAVAILDLDNFKEVNDVHGHSAGDELLRQVSLRLKKAIGKRGNAARLGGDEFAVFVHLDRDDMPDDLAHELAGALHFKADVGQHDYGDLVDCAGSAGLAIFPDDGTGTRELMANADLAMYRAKADPMRRWSRFLPEMDEEARERRTLQADLRQALERDEFDVVYQVQCAVADGSIQGFEALLRWNHPVHGVVSPDDFIPHAEESGLILPIGEWVLRRVCHEAASWDKPYKVAVNVSPIQLVQPNLPDIVTEALLDANLPAKRLEIEITESAIISDKLRALHNLRRIKHLGVSVAIDDFGTGYSSLDTLNSFAFDKIKIDRSFLMGIRRDDHSRTIVKAVLGLGRSLNLPVLAEGVETEDDLALLREENCDGAQGFYFGRPQKIFSSPGQEIEEAATKAANRIA